MGDGDRSHQPTEQSDQRLDSSIQSGRTTGLRSVCGTVHNSAGRPLALPDTRYWSKRSVRFDTHHSIGGQPGSVINGNSEFSEQRHHRFADRNSRSREWDGVPTVCRECWDVQLPTRIDSNGDCSRQSDEQSGVGRARVIRKRRSDGGARGLYRDTGKRPDRSLPESNSGLFAFVVEFSGRAPRLVSINGCSERTARALQ